MGIEKAFNVDALSFGNDDVGVFYGLTNPTDGGGFIAPIGSIYLHANGDMFLKVSNSDTGWEYLNSKMSHSVITTSYTIDSKVVILVDTTTAPVNITLPLAANSTGKFFHVKWFAGLSTNKVTVSPQAGESIDDEAFSITYSRVNVSYTFFCDGSNWWLL